jgi:hypothetical protein
MPRVIIYQQYQERISLKILTLYVHKIKTHLIHLNGL